MEPVRWSIQWWGLLGDAFGGLLGSLVPIGVAIWIAKSALPQFRSTRREQRTAEVVESFFKALSAYKRSMREVMFIGQAAVITKRPEIDTGDAELSNAENDRRALMEAWDLLYLYGVSEPVREHFKHILPWQAEGATILEHVKTHLAAGYKGPPPEVLQGEMQARLTEYDRVHWEFTEALRPVVRHELKRNRLVQRK